MSRFEWMVALRYLSARRKQAVISVITAISVLGVAAGVAALTIAIAINNGFQNALQAGLLGATAHVSVLEANPEFGITDWENISARLRKLPHVVSVTPSLYGQVALKGPLTGSGAVLKGVPLGNGAAVPDLLKHLKQGSLDAFNRPGASHSIVLGAKLAQSAGLKLHSPVTVISYQGQLTPLGPVPSFFHFEVTGIFESGVWDLDDSWCFTTLSAAQRVMDLRDVVNSLEIRIDDVFKADQVAKRADRVIGPKLIARTWMEQNRTLMDALRLERIVSIITVALIEVVAALNILVVLVMLVMEKHRDIAILMAMGTKRAQIQRIFVLQGVIISGVGIIIGLTSGFAICELFNRYKWLRLDEQIYAISYVPFQSHAADALWISGLALITALLATWHPARSAAKIAPAEALRYE